LAFARKAKKQAKGPLEKLNATSRINEHSLGVSQAKDKITLVKSQAVVGRPIAGKDRFGNSMRARKARRPNAIRGKVARDPSVGSKVKGLDPNAGKYRRVYAHNANKAAQAANRRRK
jgi:hypothetical protein